MRRFVDFDWLMDIYDDSILPEETRDYGVPMRVVRQNIADAPYVTLREDEIAEFEVVDQFWNWNRVECSMCHNNISDIGDNKCPYCGRKIVRFDK